jgi:hypothetical protein
VHQSPVVDAVPIACDVAEGIERAHRHGVLHRNVTRPLQCPSAEPGAQPGFLLGTPEYPRRLSRSVAALLFANVGGIPEAATRSGFGHRDWVAHDAGLDALRQHPRFQQLIRRGE